MSDRSLLHQHICHLALESGSMEARLKLAILPTLRILQYIEYRVYISASNITGHISFIA